MTFARRKKRVEIEPTVLVRRFDRRAREWLEFVQDEIRTKNRATFGGEGAIEGTKGEIRWWRSGTTRTRIR